MLAVGVDVGVEADVEEMEEEVEVLLFLLASEEETEAAFESLMEQNFSMDIRIKLEK